MSILQRYHDKYMNLWKRSIGFSTNFLSAFDAAMSQTTIWRVITWQKAAMS